MFSSDSQSLVYSGAENAIVGISPQYWSHIPLQIADIFSLELVNGINCIRANDGSFVPVSKCVLVGVVVNVAPRSDASVMYVLDDGTGLVDCLQWSSDVDDVYYLPSLLEKDAQAKEQLRVGDLVRVFAKIQCLSATSTDQKPCIIRELQASVIEHVETPSFGRSLDAEARHWMACIEFQKSVSNTPSEHNAIGCLQRLGPDIKSQVMERQHLPAADDTKGAWRVFGTSCRCSEKKNLGYMQSLLYCHCQARLEPLDADFKFRDGMLNTLLAMQSRNEKKLVFTYKQIKRDEGLKALAAKQVSGARSDVSVERLFLNTFRALRLDGIIFLLDDRTDHYLLITRERVLEPFIREELRKEQPSRSKNFVNIQAVPYLSSVHRERLLYIKRCLRG